MLRQHLLQRRAERGDTIVEVLISIAIVSVILGGAYVVSNSSLQSTRSAQEQSNALKIAQSQIEEVKSIITNTPDLIFAGTPPAPTNFCMSGGAVIDTTGPQKAQCTVTNPGSTQPRYTIVINRTGNVFTLQETWTDISGRHADNLQLIYRDYQ